MSVFLTKFDRSPSVHDEVSPDFAVLLAGLSAHQASSPTARNQIELERDMHSPQEQALPLTLIFTRASAQDVTSISGSFSNIVARSLNKKSEA